MRENICPGPDWYFFVPWLIGKRSIEEVGALVMGPKRPACIQAERETPKKLKPEKAANLQQSKPVKTEKSSPARTSTAEEPVEGQDKEKAEGHKRTEKGRESASAHIVRLERHEVPVAEPEEG